MIYVAKCYVGKYRPGEAFDADIPDEELKRLIARDAIEPTGATMKDVFDASGIQNEPDSVQDSGDDSDVDDESDVVDEPEAPEIDVMEGIRTDEEPEEAKPERRRSRK